MDTDIHWYALRIFWNRVERIKDVLDSRGIEYYAQNILPSYVFIHTNLAAVLKLRSDEWQNLYVYSDRSEEGNKAPVVVPDKEMEIFRIVTSAGDPGLKFLGNDPEQYRQGDKVRVTDGPFKGAEGYIKRIKKDRRLVVTISGVAAIATSFIPPELLEKV